MERYVCIHGHFYQPPRENPWLEAIELQDSASPYHDWNERIAAECYGPNAAARILAAGGGIARIVNNYASISFNFGPTLLSWLEEKKPDVYQAILDADKESRRRFSGHGAALAQAYNHMIMPLASRRDKETQVAWGVRDFQHRFGRDPEGMWLPETAVDAETLDALASHGIRFTILEPGQAKKVRPVGGSEWQDVSGRRIDPTRPYLVRLPSGHQIAVFFYDGPVSRAVAFERLLTSGEAFAGRLTGVFNDGDQRPQIVSIATDGETYGHHFRFGEMALAYAIHHIETHQLATVTNFGEYLERHPPDHEVELFEETSWSCAHGIERWRSNCGCNSGARPGWNQSWRGPLRQAFDWLRDTLGPLYEERSARLLRDPWKARDDYISVVLDRSPASLAEFFARHGGPPPDAERKVEALKFLEMQRHLMLMYTSCGWFFDDVSGIETVQVMQYAARAAELGEQLFSRPLEPAFRKRLARAPSNLRRFRTAATVYDRFVKPAAVDRRSVAAHYAVNSLFQRQPEPATVYSYTIECPHVQRLEAGKARLVLGCAQVTSRITAESSPAGFAALRFDDSTVKAAVRDCLSRAEEQAAASKIGPAFLRGDVQNTVRLAEEHFGALDHSLNALFREERRALLERVVQARVVGEGAEADVSLGSPDLGPIIQERLERMVKGLLENSANTDLSEKIAALARLVRPLDLNVDLFPVQAVYHELLDSVYPAYARRADEGNEEARRWVERIRVVGEALGVRAP